MCIRDSLRIGQHAAANQGDLGGRLHRAQIFDETGNGMQESAGRQGLLEAAVLVQIHPRRLESYFPEPFTLEDGGGGQDQGSFCDMRLTGDGGGNLHCVAGIGKKMRLAGSDEHQPVRPRIAGEITDVRARRYDQRIDFVRGELVGNGAAALFNFSQTYSLANPAGLESEINFPGSWS